jgi:hypothetical protein
VLSSINIIYILHLTIMLIYAIIYI